MEETWVNRCDQALNALEEGYVLINLDSTDEISNVRETLEICLLKIRSQMKLEYKKIRDANKMLAELRKQTNTD